MENLSSYTVFIVGPSRLHEPALLDPLKWHRVVFINAVNCKPKAGNI